MAGKTLEGSVQIPGSGVLVTFEKFSKVDFSLVKAVFKDRAGNWDLFWAHLWVQIFEL